VRQGRETRNSFHGATTPESRRTMMMFLLSSVMLFLLCEQQPTEKVTGDKRLVSVAEWIVVH